MTTKPVISPEQYQAYFKDRRGHVEVMLTVYEDGDPRFQEVDEHGQKRNVGVKLGHMRKLFKGHEGVMRDTMKGEAHHISLKPWEHADPDKTYVLLGFKFIDD